MPRGDAAGGGFGEEGLVGHVRPGVDDRDGRLAVAHLLENAPSCVQAYVPTAYYEDPGTLRGAHAIEYPPAPGVARAPLHKLARGCVILRDSHDPGPVTGPGPRVGSPRCQGRVSCRSTPRDPWTTPPRHPPETPANHPAPPRRARSQPPPHPGRANRGSLLAQLDRIPCEELHELSCGHVPKRVRERPLLPLIRYMGCSGVYYWPVIIWGSGPRGGGCSAHFTRMAADGTDGSQRGVLAPPARPPRPPGARRRPDARPGRGGRPRS